MAATPHRPLVTQATNLLFLFSFQVGEHLFEIIQRANGSEVGILFHVGSVAEASLDGLSQQRQGASRDTSRGGGPTPKGQRFIEENDWFDDEDYEAERAACLAIERRLLRDGSDPNQPGHYTRLARELKRKFPSLDVTVPRFGVDLEDEDEDGEEEEDGREHRQQRRAPVSRARSGGDAAPPRRSRSTELTEDDKREMRRFHLDPNDNKQVLEWTRNKAASEVAYARSR